MEFQQPPGPSRDGEELVVTTPERVSFQLETAGLGSRFAAQLIDGLALAAILAALGLAAAGLGALLNNGPLALLALIMLGFLTFWAYWIVPEALWSGVSLGKLALHLRVVDAGGGPLTVGQAIVRNLLRIVDFLPAYYAVGAIAIFVSSRNQRLGDLVAGTVVVRERMAVRLADLRGMTPPSDGSAPAPLAPRRALDPALRRFLVAYAQRRPYLQPPRREELAREVEPALRALLPEVVAEHGLLGALDRLADEQL